MWRDEGVGAGCPSAPAVSDRRKFLGIGLGCAVPLVAGIGPTMGGGRVLHEFQETVAPDAVFEHLAGEVWRIGHEMHGVNMVRGEHVRRLAGHLDVFAVHLRARRDDEQLDAEIRRAVSEHGREALAERTVLRYREDGADWRPPFGPDRRLDPAAALRVVDQVHARGAVAVLRAHRAAMERFARSLDGARTVCGAAPVTLAAGQKPGDDIMGYGDVRDYDGCTMLRAAAAACTLLAGFSVAGPLAAAGAFYAAMAAVLDVAMTYLCQSEA
jgi:hypothetical protein